MTTARGGRRGMALLELLLAIAITAMVGVGIASMMTMVSAAATGDQDRRSSALRAHAAQVRLRAYLQPALCALQHEDKRGMAIWLEDTRPENNVHLSELRALWWNDLPGGVTLERVQFPEGWTEMMKEQADTALPAGSDYLLAIETARLQGWTTTETIVDDVTACSAAFNGATPADSVRVRVQLTIGEGVGAREMLLAFGLANHHKPGS